MKDEAPVKSARRGKNKKILRFNPQYELNVKKTSGKYF